MYYQKLKLGEIEDAEKTKKLLGDTEVKDRVLAHRFSSA